MKVDGACHCGAITVEGDADPARVTVCHCTDCQTGAGTAFRVSVPVAGDSFKISGKPTIYVKKTADSGHHRWQAFCSTCGTPIYSTTPGEEQQPLYLVRAGILRQRDQLEPKRQIWFRSSRPWITKIGAIEPKLEKDK